jgi:hypothetical protein
MAVVAGTPELLDRIDPRGPAPVIANGVDPDLWLSLPAPLPGRPSGTLGFYAGTVDGRLDTQAIRSLAATGLYIDLVGPLRDEDVRRALEACGGCDCWDLCREPRWSPEQDRPTYA